MAVPHDGNRVEAPQETGAKGDVATQHIDRVALLKSDRPDGSQAAATPPSDGVGLKNSKEPATLDFTQNDPLAKLGQPRSEASGDDSHDVTRGVKTDKKHNPKEAAPDKPESKPVAGGAEKPPEAPFTVLNDTSKLDPKKPTVLFLDDFRKDAPGLHQDPKDKSLIISQSTEIAVNEVTTDKDKGLKEQRETGFTHGEFSARMAEENGFNAIRVQQNGLDGKGIVDFSKSLNGIADQIDSGKLKMGKGDVVNVSMGEVDPSFEQVNRLLRSTPQNTITPENVKNPEVQKDILDRLAKSADDPSQPQVLRDWSKILLDTNKAVQRLQGQGVEVLHAAANNGKDSFSLDFLSANKELVSADPKTGKLDNFAAEHGRATPANGVYPIRFQPGPEQGGGRDGKYTVEGAGITFRGSEFGSLNMQQSVSVSGRAIASEEKVNQIFADKIGREAPPRNNENGYLVAVAAGDSFANIDYLAKNRERLAAMKRGDGQ